MIFTTYEEAKRVDGIIAEKKPFDDLTENQNAFIGGMYAAIHELENFALDFEVGEGEDGKPTLLEQFHAELVLPELQELKDRLESTIAEHYVSFGDYNYEKEEESRHEESDL